MGKRKRRHRDSDDEIRQKIRRLERKLRDDRYSRPRSRDSYRRSETSPSATPPPSYYDDYYRTDQDVSDGDYYPDTNMDDSRPSVQVQSAPTEPAAGPSTSENDLQSSAQIRSVVLEPVPSTSHQESETLATLNNENEQTCSDLTPEIPQEILNILGEAKKLDQALGEKIPSEISKRWGEILVDGLAKDQRDSLIEKMLIPENFLLARAPKLNPEVAAVLTDAVKNRDKRLEKAQNQLGTGLAGLVTLTKDLINSDLDKMNIIKRISEISQILLDLHYEDTINRRKLILPLLDKKFWTTIQGVKRENFLFGDKLGENIKNTKDIEKSSQQIRKPILKQPQFPRKNPLAGNFRAPPRQQSSGAKTATPAAARFQPAAAAARRSTTQQRAVPASSNKSHDRRRR